jgi:sec-independent protein translocase protein TatB
MLDLAWPELLVIGVVALVAIGPKDMPKAMYALGRFAGKARVFAQDLHRAFEEASRVSEAEEKSRKNESTPPPQAPQ